MFAAIAFALVTSIPGPSLAGCVHAPDPTKRAVEVHVAPWADIIVDGVTVARGQMSAHLELTVGPHELKLVNPQAREVERVVVVPADGSVPDVFVKLEPKPTVVRLVGHRGAVALDVVVQHKNREARLPDAYTVHHRTMNVVAGETAAVEVRLDPPSPQ